MFCDLLDPTIGHRLVDPIWAVLTDHGLPMGAVVNIPVVRYIKAAPKSGRLFTSDFGAQLQMADNGQDILYARLA